MTNEEKKYWLRRDFIVDLLKQLPAHVFWKNRENIYLGCNDAFAKSLGLDSAEQIVGKSDYDLPIKKERSTAFRKDDIEVMDSRQPKLNIEEEQVFSDGRKAYLLTNKVPLLSKSNEVIGVLGVYYDITELKRNQEEIALLKLENEIQKQSAKNQEKFTKLANQVAHDIRSPLASLLMIVKSCTEIPEADRIALREAAISIGDIANHLLSHYQKKESGAPAGIEQRNPLLISSTLLQLLTDKKYQYRHRSVKFEDEITSGSHFAFIKIEPSAFKRMISNLINNAVDALEGRSGKIHVKLDADNEWVIIKIQDNGKGMPEEVIKKIENRMAVTVGKEAGHGIGLTQVQETLDRNQGELAISSKLGTGTIMTLTFPRIKTPSWLAEVIHLRNNDIVIILDDDPSIHSAWKIRLEPIVKTSPDIQLQHFQMATEVLAFIDNLSEIECQWRLKPA